MTTTLHDAGSIFPNHNFPASASKSSWLNTARVFSIRGIFITSGTFLFGLIEIFLSSLFEISFDLLFEGSDASDSDELSICSALASLGVGTIAVKHPLCCSMSLIARSKSSCAVMAQEVRVAVGVVGVVVRLTIAEPAGVGIVSADVI